jgi:hypothetical protein
MDFYFYKEKVKLINDKEFGGILCENEITISKNNYIIKYGENCQAYIEKESLLLFSGRVLYDGLNNIDSKKKFSEDIKNSNWPLPDSIHGYFSGFLISEEKIHVFTDPIGIYNLFYYVDENCIVISSSLGAVQKTVKASLNYAGLVLETLGHYSQYSTMTVFNEIKRLYSGQLLKIEKNEIVGSLFDYTIKTDDIIPPKTIAEDLVKLINDESKLLYDEDVIISLSGGIDSRVNLAPLLNNNNSFEAINYGEKDLLDSKIPNDIARKFKFNINFIDPTPFLFPKKEIINEFVSKTGSLYVNSWHSILLVKKEPKLFLLGDMIDILRAKSISSLKTRKFRVNFYLNKFFFGKKLQLNAINSSNIVSFKENKISLLVANIEKSFVNFNFTENQKKVIKNEAINDITNLFKHIDNYNCKYVESYEELFVIFTSGRLAMGKQLNLLQYKYKTEIPLLNIKILRKVLNISPNYRYADELTTKMFRSKTWKKLGNFPTSQNPFFAYNSSFYLMLVGWFLRSKIDFFLTRMNVVSKGKFKKTRLFRSFDIQKSYCYPQSFDNFKSYFEPNEIYKYEDKIDLFEGRMNKTYWPYSSMDLMPHVQVMNYIKYSQKKDKIY